MEIPLCFSTPADFQRWRISRVARQDRCKSHCIDCLPAYQLRMKKLSRCEHPEVMFSLDADGGPCGGFSF